MSDDRPNRPDRWALLRRLLLSGFAGGMLGLALSAHARGIWDGVLIGVVSQVVIRGVVGSLLGGRQDSAAGAVVSIGAGLAVAAGVASLSDSASLDNLLAVGGLVGVVDCVVAWVIFPSSRPTRTADPDADLQDDAPDDEP